MSLSMYKCMYVCQYVHVCVYLCASVCMCVCTCVPVCVCVVYDTYRKLGKARSIFQIFTFGNITRCRNSVGRSSCNAHVTLSDFFMCMLNFPSYFFIPKPQPPTLLPIYQFVFAGICFLIALLIITLV